MPATWRSAAATICSPPCSRPRRGPRSLAEAGAEAHAVADAVEAGAFPVAPDDLFTCNFCGFAAVCRKDYVGDE